MGHIELSRDRELILVAPASADFLAKLAHGLADDLLSTLCVARRCPLMVAPAMNVEMWQNAATARNAETLRADGVHDRRTGVGRPGVRRDGDGTHDRAGGHPRRPAVFFSAENASRAGASLVTAGPDRGADRPGPRPHQHQLREDGLRGRARGARSRRRGDADQRPGVAADAAGRGARRRAHRAGDVRRGEEGREGRRRVHLGRRGRRLPRQELRPTQKIKKANGHLSLELEENPDILAWVAGLPKPPFCVGFAAESENLAQNAKAKLAKKKLPLIVGNLAQDALGRDDSAITLYDANGEHPSAAARSSSSRASWSSTSPASCQPRK